MDFFGAVRICFNKYVNFGGRASRSEFWLFVLFVVLGGLILGVIDGVVGIEQGDPVSLGNAFGLLTFLPGLAVAVRRLHDTNRSGLWLLLWFSLSGLSLLLWYPPIGDLAVLGILDLAIVFGILWVVSFFTLLYWYCIKGDARENRFGLAPRANTQDATISTTLDSNRQGE